MTSALVSKATSAGLGGSRQGWGEQLGRQFPLPALIWGTALGARARSEGPDWNLAAERMGSASVLGFSLRSGVPSRAGAGRGLGSTEPASCAGTEGREGGPLGDNAQTVGLSVRPRKLEHIGLSSVPCHPPRRYGPLQLGCPLPLTPGAGPQGSTRDPETGDPVPTGPRPPPLPFL